MPALMLLIVLRMVSFVSWSSSARPCPLMRTFAYLACGVSDPEGVEGPAACAAKRSPEPPTVSELGSKEEAPAGGLAACLGIRGRSLQYRGLGT